LSSLVVSSVSSLRHTLAETDAGEGRRGREESTGPLSPPPTVSRIPQRHPAVPRAESFWKPATITPTTSSLMPELPDFIRASIRTVQVAFDRQWSSVWGLRTPQRAGRIVWGTRGPLVLDGVERISLGAAAVLARHDSVLRLPSLRELSPELARILAQHRRRLYLDGLRSLDALTAKALAAHGLETVRRSWRESLEALKAIEEMPSPGDPGWEPEHELELTDALFLRCGMLEMLTLSLSGLRRLSPSAARQLGQHKGVLILDGLKEISDEVAQELGNHFGSLELNGLRSLSAAAARALARGAGEWPKGFTFDDRLSLNGLRNISGEVAGELARYQGPLRLDGLRELTPEVAEALSGFNPQCTYDRLSLGGLRRLDPEVAKRLAPLRATLSLGGLGAVSPELAEALIEVRGRLHLPGVRRLSTEAAGILLSRLEVNLTRCVW
jgi:hypothetical protein